MENLRRTLATEKANLGSARRNEAQALALPEGQGVSMRRISVSLSPSNLFRNLSMAFSTLLDKEATLEATFRHSLETIAKVRFTGLTVF